MDSYDKAIEFQIDSVTAGQFSAKDLKATGKVLITQALVKEGYTVDEMTEYHAVVTLEAIKVRARRCTE